LKVISGTKRNDTPADPQPIPLDQTLLELPPAPDTLPNDIARQEWVKVGTLLLSRGLLDETRITPFTIYCALTGKIMQKFQAGDVPAAHLIAQHKSLGKELGIIGGGEKITGDKPAAETSRFASLKARSQRPD
jgi:hypothetical protein